MRFSLSKPPFKRTKLTTTKMMLSLTITLVIVWIASIIASFYHYGNYYGVMSILIGVSSLATTFLIDLIVGYKKGKKGKELFKFVLTSYSYVTALIYALCLPVGTSIYVVVLGAVVGTLVAKYLFGGFGYNIFNPAAIGRTFVGLAFANKLVVPEVALYDLSAGATITGKFDWNSVQLPGSYSYKTLLLGGYPSALGESFTILLIVIGIFLIIRGIANWRLTLFYLLSVASVSFGLSLALKTGYPHFYTLNHLLSGGILFGAVFMISDPVTAPKDSFGKIVYAVGAGILTMLLRVNSIYPEGVVFSILIMNLLTPSIEFFTKGLTNKKILLKWASIAILLLIGITSNVLISKYITFNDTNTNYYKASHVLEVKL